jgi:hypothetical protein
MREGSVTIGARAPTVCRPNLLPPRASLPAPVTSLLGDVRPDVIEGDTEA